MIRRLLASLLRMILRPIVRLLFRVKVEGVFDTGGGSRVVIIANHESFIDGLLIGLFLPVNPVFVVHTAIARQPMFRLALSLIDYLTVDPSNPMAIKSILKLVQQGRPVVIFPEGRLTVTGGLMKVYDGPAFVAARTGATLIPVRLDGPARSTFARLRGEARRQWFPRVRLSILSPCKIEQSTGGTARTRRHHAGEAMRRIMQHMMFASHPVRPLFWGLVEAGRTQGWSMPIIEDVRQTPFNYRQIVRQALGAGRYLAARSEPGERIGMLLPISPSPPPAWSVPPPSSAASPYSIPRPGRTACAMR